MSATSHRWTEADDSAENTRAYSPTNEWNILVAISRANGMYERQYLQSRRTVSGRQEAREGDRKPTE